MTSGTPYWLVMPAAGRGTRIAAERPKQYLTLAGRSMIEWALAPFLEDHDCRGLAIALSADDADWPAVRERLVRASGDEHIEVEIASARDRDATATGPSGEVSCRPLVSVQRARLERVQQAR